MFAGRVGWLVQDLMQQLKNTDWLDGKIILVDSPSDAELETLYEDCLFTLFPSFYEGWGLPVTESLAMARPAYRPTAPPCPRRAVIWRGISIPTIWPRPCASCAR